MLRFLIVTLALLVTAPGSFAQGDHVYMGMKKCSMCHKGEVKGAIFEKWQGSQHAKAFTNLTDTAAAEVYKKLGKTGNPQQDAACLKCHITGAGADSAKAVALIKDEGVTCEACHGAGADYGKMSVMKDKAAAVAAGMSADPKATCIKCHNQESPTFKAFKFEEMWTKIAHAKPKAAG